MHRVSDELATELTVDILVACCGHSVVVSCFLSGALACNRVFANTPGCWKNSKQQRLLLLIRPLLSLRGGGHPSQPK